MTIEKKDTPNNLTPTNPPIGAAAPSNPPPVDQNNLAAIIKEQVEREVSERLRAIEADDPTREKMRPDEDLQFSTFDKKLDVFGIDLAAALPGFTLRFVNDERDRVLRMQAQGWDFVKRTDVALIEKVTPLNKDMGENIAIYVGGDEQGKPLRAFLMKIPNPMFEKIMAQKKRMDDMIEDSIRRGEIGTALANKGYAGTDQGVVKINYNPRQAR